VTKKLNLDADNNFLSENHAGTKLSSNLQSQMYVERTPWLKESRFQRGKQHSADENGRQLCQANFDNFFLLRISLGRSYLRDAPAIPDCILAILAMA
jgi:hypothetical protein